MLASANKELKRENRKKKRGVTSMFSTARWQHAASTAWPSWKYHSASSSLTFWRSLQLTTYELSKITLRSELFGSELIYKFIPVSSNFYIWITNSDTVVKKMLLVWTESIYAHARSSGLVSQNQHQYGNVSDWGRRNTICGYSSCTCEYCISLSKCLKPMKVHAVTTQTPSSFC